MKKSLQKAGRSRRSRINRRKTQRKVRGGTHTKSGAWVETEASGLALTTFSASPTAKPVNSIVTATHKKESASRTGSSPSQLGDFGNENSFVNTKKVPQKK